MPKRTDIQSVMVIGSGPIVIGQACEFDYSGTQACRVLKAEGLRVILLNSNPATIMTDPDVADATYLLRHAHHALVNERIYARARDEALRGLAVEVWRSNRGLIARVAERNAADRGVMPGGGPDQRPQSHHPRASTATCDATVAANARRNDPLRVLCLSPFQTS